MSPIVSMDTRVAQPLVVSSAFTRNLNRWLVMLHTWRGWPNNTSTSVECALETKFAPATGACSVIKVASWETLFYRCNAKKFYRCDAKKEEIPVKKLDYLPLMIPAKKKTLLTSLGIEGITSASQYENCVRRKHWSEHQAETKKTARDLNKNNGTQLRRTEIVSRSSQFIVLKLFVLLLIGWKTGARFLSQSLSVAIAIALRLSRVIWDDMWSSA